MQLKWSRFNVEVLIPEYKVVVIFNTLSRSLVSLDQELIESLRQNDFSQLSEQELQKLKGAKIIVDQQLDEIAYMRYMLGTIKYTQATLGLFICFTAECNLKCSYCYEDYRDVFQRNRILSWSNFGRLLKFIDYQKDKWGLQHIEVVLYGGEPLINYEILHKAIKALKNYKNTSVSVTIDLITNGTLLTVERCRELAPYITSVQVTLDGPKDVHDQRRPYKDGRGSYEDIVSNLESAVKYFKIVLVRSVVDSHNAPFIPDMLQELKERGLHDKIVVGFAPTWPSQTTLAAGGCSGRPDIKASQIVSQLYTFAAQLGYTTLAKAFINGPCVRVCANQLGVDEYMNVYKCPGDFYGPFPDAIIDKNGHLQILRSNWYESVAFEPPCIVKCVYGPICYGGCKWLAGGPTKIYCNKEKLDLFIAKLIRAYVMTRYKEKLQRHQERI